MAITAITQQVRNPERASIFIDGKYSFSLSLSELVQEKLKVGLELSEADNKRLKKLSADGKLKAKALEWSLLRPRSQKELRDYLWRKKADPEVRDMIITEFVTKGFVNDESFARFITELRQRKGKSNRAIVAELRSKGISTDIIESLKAEDNPSEIERIRRIIGAKRRQARYKDPLKLTAYLARQGFSYDDIRQALAET